MLNAGNVAKQTSIGGNDNWKRTSWAGGASFALIPCASAASETFMWATRSLCFDPHSAFYSSSIHFLHCSVPRHLFHWPGSRQAPPRRNAQLLQLAIKTIRSFSKMLFCLRGPTKHHVCNTPPRRGIGFHAVLYICDIFVHHPPTNHATSGYFDKHVAGQ